MRPEVTYTPYSTSSKEKTGDIITFSQFEEGNIWTETRNDAESGDKSDNKKFMMSEQDMEEAMKMRPAVTYTLYATSLK